MHNMYVPIKTKNVERGTFSSKEYPGEGREGLVRERENAIRTKIFYPVDPYVYNGL